MDHSDGVRYNINASKSFDKELRETVRNRSISSFFIEAARKELKRIRKERAMKLVKEMPDPLAAIADPAAYIHDLRRRDTEHRLHKREI